MNINESFVYAQTVFTVTALMVCLYHGRKKALSGWTRRHFFSSHSGLAEGPEIISQISEWEYSTRCNNCKGKT